MAKKASLMLAGVVAGFVGVKLMLQSTLKYFDASEFGAWWPLMDADLLARLDAFRSAWGRPVKISPAPGALGRPGAPTSQHFPGPTVKAVDVMPEGMTTAGERRRAFEIARRVGFTGIGVYPEWSPAPGMHLDTRRDRVQGEPATWSGWDTADGGQVYRGIHEAFA